MFELGMFLFAILVACAVVYRYGGPGGKVVIDSVAVRHERDEEVLKRLSQRPGARVSRINRSSHVSEPAFTAEAYTAQLARLQLLQSLVSNSAIGTASARVRWKTRLQGLADQLEDLTRTPLESSQVMSDELRFGRIVRETNAIVEEIHDAPTT